MSHKRKGEQKKAVLWVVWARGRDLVCLVFVRLVRAGYERADATRIDECVYAEEDRGPEDVKVLRNE